MSEKFYLVTQVFPECDDSNRPHSRNLPGNDDFLSAPFLHGSGELSCAQETTNSRSQTDESAQPLDPRFTERNPYI